MNVTSRGRGRNVDDLKELQGLSGQDNDRSFEIHIFQRYVFVGALPLTETLEYKMSVLVLTQPSPLGNDFCNDGGRGKE